MGRRLSSGDERAKAHHWGVDLVFPWSRLEVRTKAVKNRWVMSHEDKPRQSRTQGSEIDMIEENFHWKRIQGWE